MSDENANGAFKLSVTVTFGLDYQHNENEFIYLNEYE